MANVNWRFIAFWAALWWFVYTAPTQGDFLSSVLLPQSASQDDRMEEF